jgi:hypothetical protein
MQPYLINFPKIKDKRGNLTFFENGIDFPFKIKRIFYLFDVPSGVTRGGHAYLNQSEIIIPLNGSFHVVYLDFEFKEKKVFLNKPNVGLFLPNLTWRHIENYSTNSVSLHISDSDYTKDDYVYDIEFFKNL